MLFSRGDVRFAIRALVRRPGFAAAAIGTLALGIGAVSVVFSVVNSVLLRPLPYPHPERLIVLGEEHAELDSANGFASPPNVRDWQERNRTFEAIIAWQRTRTTLTGGAGADVIEMLRVTPGFFRMMEVLPVLGRGFVEKEGRPGESRVVVLSHALWRQRFGADPQIVGRSLTLDGEPHVVVGVAAEGFRFTQDVDLWAPLALEIERWPRDFRWAGVLGRLRDGVGLDQARADMGRVAAQLEREHPVANAGWGVSVEGLGERMVRRVRPILLLLLGAVALVLAIAVANVAGLLSYRGEERRREIAVRRALGAGGLRLFRQQLTEGLVLSLPGAALGLLVAYQTVSLVPRILPERFPRAAELGVDPRVAGFATLLALAAGLVFGALPVLQGAGAGLVRSLKESGPTVAGGRRSAIVRTGLVAGEVALAVLLLVGAVLLIRSVTSLLAVDPGFTADGVLAVSLDLPPARYPGEAEQIAFFREVVERAGALPGVAAAGTVFPMPFAGTVAPYAFSVEGRPGGGPRWETPMWLAGPGYIEAMGIPLLRGRSFNDADAAGAPYVALVNRSFAERFLAGEDPVGRRIALGADPPDETTIWWTIVGVVGDVRQGELSREGGPQLYVPTLQTPFRAQVLVLRAEGDPAVLVEPLRRAVQAIDPDLPLADARLMTRVLADSLGDRTLTTSLLGGFAGIALALAATGIFALLSYSVARRGREMGIRMALGASAAHVMALVLRGAMVPVGVGLAAGLAAAAGLVRFLAFQIHGVSPGDPVTFVVGAGVLVVVSLAASALPAWRAAHVHPARVLRSE